MTVKIRGFYERKTEIFETIFKYKGMQAMKKIQLLLLSLTLCAFAETRMITLDPHTNIPLGGNIRGFGILAEYPEGGPGIVRLERNLKKVVGGKAHYYWQNIATLRVFDPNGKLAAIADLGLQKEIVQEYSLKIPKGPAGIWRFSVTAFSSDNYKISFPETEIWGVRGEMMLGFGKLFPKTLHLYIPETAELLIAEVYGWKKAGIPILYEGKNIADFRKKGRILSATGNLPNGKTVSLDVSTLLGGKGLAIDGMPGLLCPTPEAAMRLKGGLIEVGDTVVCGPLQARARKYQLKMKPEDFKVDLVFPEKAPVNLKDPQLNALLFGKYGGGLSCVASFCDRQLTDVSKRQCGTWIAPEKRKNLSNRRKFLKYSVPAIFTAKNIAMLITAPLELNIAYKNKGLLNRAILADFAKIVMMQGDDLLRENDFRTNNYPILHMFFGYQASAEAFYRLKDLLPEEAREIWREFVVATGDKIAGHMSYESNQWIDVFHGHLQTYLATGEERFRRYFEQFMNAYLDDSFGPASKYGQHPAGYFLEEYGPDGNYDHLNMTTLVECYYLYGKVKNPDPVLTKKIKNGIQKNLEFKKFLWTPGENCPTALNCRIYTASISGASFPAVYLAKREFDLAYTRTMFDKMPENGVGFGAIMSYIINSDEWALRLIDQELKSKGRTWNSFFNDLGIIAYEAYNRPQKAKEVKLPYEIENGFWQLPGLFAWNRNGIYGLVFADVAGANPKKILNGITSGGPLGLWNRESGWFIKGMHLLNNKKMEKIEDVIWSGIAGTLPDGKFFASGKERNTIHAEKDGKKVSVTGVLRKNAGKIRWDYDFADDGLNLTVTLTDSGLKDPVLILPVKKGLKPEQITDGVKIGKVTIQASKAQLAQSRHEIPQIRISFPQNGIIKVKIR